MDERQTIYDQLSRVLTDFDTNSFDGATDASIDLYAMLVVIQNRWEDVITVQDCGCGC